MGGLFLFGGLLSSVFLLVPVVLVLALLVILALRHDDDVDGHRAPAIYGSIVAFVGLLTVLFAVTGMAASLASISADDTHGAIGVSERGVSSSIGPDGTVSFASDDASSDDDDAAVTSAVGFLVAGLAALGLLAAHRQLFDRRFTVTGAAQRVHRAYLLVLCLVVALIATGAAAAAVYALYRTLFPGTSGLDDRADGVRALVPLVVLFVGAGGLWRWHWRQLEISEAIAP